RPLIVNTADLRGQRQLLHERLAQHVAMVGRELLEPRAPRGVIDGAPDRLHFKSVGGHFLDLSPEGLQPGKRNLEGSSDIGRNRPTKRGEAECNLAPAQVAVWRRSLD